MSERGVYAVDRGIWDHPDFANEPFTEREAWHWLIGSCAWEPKRVRVGHSVVDLERGQCAFSLRFMAKRWQWSEPRVRRFLNRSKTDARAVVDSTQGTTRITVCNYDKYQFGRRSDVSTDDAPTDAAPTQHRRKEEELKEPKKEEKKDSGFEEFWKACPKRQGSNPKALAEKKFKAVVKAGADPQAITLAARQWATSDRDKIGTPYLPQVSTWLGQQRFDDYRPPPPPTAALQAPAGAPSDEELRKKYGQQHHAVPPETKAIGGNGVRVDHTEELRRQSLEIRPGLRAF